MHRCGTGHGRPGPGRTGAGRGHDRTRSGTPVRELPELQRQSTSFQGVADSLGVAMALTVLPGHHHDSILDELARPDGALTSELVRLVSA